MPSRFCLFLIAVGMVATGCASPTHCDEDGHEAYMDPRTGEALDLEGLLPREQRSRRFQVPGEEGVDPSRANPCLAQSPRIVPPPLPTGRDVEDGTAFADLRYRMEMVDQDGFDERAQASTLRLRLGGTTPRAQGFDAGVAFQTNQRIGDRRYDDTTGQTSDFPVVRDPADTAVSEGWVRYMSREGFVETRLGRQALSLDNERFLGTDSFRQLEQTFNAATLRLGSGEPGQFDVKYITQVNRVLGANHPDRLMAKADSEAAMVEYNHAIGDRTLGLYVHNMRFNDANESHRNYGIRLHGRVPWTERFDFRLEFAQQEELNNEGPEEELGYQNFRLGQTLEGWQWYLGRERLAGNRQDSFQTPLASLHDHNGWSDRFLVTPAFGLVDRHAGVVFQRGVWDFETRYHEFQVDAGSGRYGQELGVRAGREIFGEARLDLKLSRYQGNEPVFYVGDDYADDSTRIWLGLTARFDP